MAAPTPARALLPALLAGVMMGALGPAPARAVERIPAEDAALLAGDTYAAMVGDVDGDGRRELVRLLPWETNPGQLALEVVSMRGGAPVAHGQALVRRAASVEDYASGNNPDQAELLPLSTSEPARLIAWRQGRSERVLLATMQGEPGSALIERSCCLTLWWVELDRDGATELRLIQNTVSSGAWIVPADMDADGTDELAVVQTPNPAVPNASEVLVLRWNGTDFDRLRDTARDGVISGPLVSLGDSDGLPGEEVGYVALPGTFDAVAPTLYRVALVDGTLRVDRTELPRDGEVAPIDGPLGGRLALVSGSGVDLLTWPAAVPDARVEAASARGGSLLGVIGSGERARLLVLRGGAVDLLDAGLTSRQGLAGGDAASWFAASSLPAYRGELPGGDAAGAPKFIFGGRLIGAPDGSSQASFQDIAALPGKVPVGMFGPGAEWVAVADGPAMPAGRRGGGLLVGFGARAASVAVVPVASLLAPEADGGLVRPQILGAILDDSQPARPILVTGSDARGRVHAPAGSRLVVTGRDGTASATALPGDVADVVLVEARDDTDDDERFTVRLLVSTPAGHGYGAIWQVRVERRPPGLTASAPMLPLDFSVPLSGRTDPAARLTIDGEEVPLQPDGSFTAEVVAGPLPRAVRLQATDPVGNTSELVLEVVGVLDYRRLPWIPIIVGLTLITGALLYLRTPRPASVGTQHPDEGVLEEIQ